MTSRSFFDAGAGDSKKRWLTYNMLGGISSREDNGLLHRGGLLPRCCAAPPRPPFSQISTTSAWPPSSTAGTFLSPHQTHMQHMAYKGAPTPCHDLQMLLRFPWTNIASGTHRYPFRVMPVR